jgi:hypothetical protein
VNDKDEAKMSEEAIAWFTNYKANNDAPQDLIHDFLNGVITREQFHEVLPAAVVVSSEHPLQISWAGFIWCRGAEPEPIRMSNGNVLENEKKTPAFEERAIRTFLRGERSLQNLKYMVPDAEILYDINTGNVVHVEWKGLTFFPPLEYDDGRVKVEKTNNPVTHPSHYTQYQGFEVIDVARQLVGPDKMGGFHLGNAFKYIARAGYKNPEKHVEDLEKAVFYIQAEIERIKNLKKE